MRSDDDPLLTDRALLDAFRRGERWALERVFRAYVGVVTYVVRSGVVVASASGKVKIGSDVPASELESIVHDVFVKAFSEKARAGYDGVRPYQAYLVVVTRNTLIDRHRRQQRRGEEVWLEDIPPRSLALPDAPGPLEQAEQGRISALVEEVKAGFTPVEVGVFQARFVDGLSLRDTAAALQISVSTVRRAEARTRRRLLDRLLKEGYGPGWAQSPSPRVGRD